MDFNSWLRLNPVTVDAFRDFVLQPQRHLLPLLPPLLSPFCISGWRKSQMAKSSELRCENHEDGANELQSNDVTLIVSYKCFCLTTASYFSLLWISASHSSLFDFFANSASTQLIAQSYVLAGKSNLCHFIFSSDAISKWHWHDGRGERGEGKMCQW